MCALEEMNESACLKAKCDRGCVRTLRTLYGYAIAGYLWSNGSHIGLLLWFHAASLAVLHLTCVISAAMSVSDVVACRALRSRVEGELLVPRARLAARQRRAFSVAGPSIWNDLPSELRLLPLTNQTGFYNHSSLFFSRGWAGSAPE